VFSKASKRVVEGQLFSAEGGSQIQPGPDHQASPWLVKKVLGKASKSACS